ncbi:MAG: class I SAM-dependent methyltransferase [Gaiellaceae bacterium]
MARVTDAEGAQAAALERLADLTGVRVLEVGCGEGRLTWSFASRAASVLAIDPDGERVAQARADLPVELEERVRFGVAPAHELEEPPDSFDVAFLSWSL